jgi:multisubunit Na+/H+ antiporter MnhB subunit
VNACEKRLTIYVMCWMLGLGVGLLTISHGYAGVSFILGVLVGSSAVGVIVEYRYWLARGRWDR